MKGAVLHDAVKRSDEGWRGRLDPITAIPKARAALLLR
jgi:hypothetical protein